MFLPGNFKEAGELQSMGLKRDTPEHTCMHAHTHTHTHTHTQNITTSKCNKHKT